MTIASIPELPADVDVDQVAATSDMNLTDREGVILDVQLLIDEALASPDDISPWTLAESILAAVEAKIRTVDDDGTVVYHD